MVAETHYKQARVLPLAIRLQARSLYVQIGHPPSVIAQLLNVPVQRIYQLVSHEKWNREKVKTELKSQESARVRTEASISEIVEAVAQRTEELGLRTLDLSEQFLVAGDAQKLQQASQAAMNFVKMARMSRGLDARQTAATEGQTIVMLMRCDAAQPRPEPRNITPAAQLTP